MGVAIAFELVVEIWMGVDVKNRQRGVVSAETANDWIGNRVITAERDERSSVPGNPRDAFFNQQASLAVRRQREVTEIFERFRCARLHQSLGPRIAGGRMERGANHRRRRRRASQIRRAGVVRDADQHRTRRHGYLRAAIASAAASNTLTAPIIVSTTRT
jgi:hypothetical protein